MSDNKHSWLTGWGGLMTGLGTIAMAIITYVAWAHPPGNTGQQSFSIPVGVATTSSHFWQKEPSLDFEVKQCSIGAKLVTCVLVVSSSRYDRRFMISPYETTLIDSDGDKFRMTSDSVNTTLERDQKFPFKLAFQVNKDIVRPATLRMIGHIDDQPLNHGFEIK